jgi:UDPglucose--hexose-1-phosphate uridylyltransferase
MSELRRNALTREWVIIAHERARSPEDFRSTITHPSPPEHDEACPFCPGNEEQTPREIYRVKDGATWRLRVVPNMYPAVSEDVEPERTVDGLNLSIKGAGFHQVIVEHPRHDLAPAAFTEHELEEVVRTWRIRYAETCKDERIELVTLFKNRGRGSGTSIIHPHSQIIALPVVPRQYRALLNNIVNYADSTGKCLICTMYQEELASGDRIVLWTPHHIVFIPYAALSPYHMWIFPKEHRGSFGDITDEEVADLAKVLKSVFAKLDKGLADPDYNMVIREAPIKEKHNPHYHWYISVVPRVSQVTGFELGSGVFVNTLVPEDAAAYLRSIE